MTRRLLLLLFLLLVTRPLAAQTGAIVSYELDVFDTSIDPRGTGTPVWIMTLPAASVLCNLVPLPPPTTLTQINPQAVYWADPINAGKICKVSTILLGTLPPLGMSTYLLTVTVTDDRGLVSPRSAVSMPFNNAPPARLSGVNVR